MTDLIVPPSTSSTPDSDDEFNTAQARIYFGPLKSPEKRFAPQSNLHPVLFNSPRRSPRFSTPQPFSPSPNTKQELTCDPSSHPHEESTEIVDPTTSRAGTPDVEQVLQDEPPSALAIRISRAYDNPSPPPSLPIESGQGDAPPISFSPIPSLTNTLLESANASDAEASTPPMSSSTTPGLSREISPAPTPSDSSQHPELISHEIPSSTSPPIPLTTCEVHPNDDPEPPPSALPSSPQDPQVSNESLPEPPTVISEVKSPEVEMATVDTLHQEHSEEQSVSSLLLPNDEVTHVLTPNRPSPNPGTFDDATPTPTQQTTRTPISTQDQDNETLHSSSEQSDSDVHEENIITEEKGKRTMWSQTMISPPKPAFIRELGSLSPTSNDLLGSLIARPSLPHAGSSMRRPFPSSPLKGLPQTPKRSTGPIRFSTPSRSMARESNNTGLRTINMDDPTSTPARRIPIEEAIAQGHVPSLKGSQLLASSARAGSDSTQRPFLIPPTDSPARRVLTIPEEATPVARKGWQAMRFESPAKTNSKDSRPVPPPAPRAFVNEISWERSSSVPPPSSSSSQPPAFGTDTAIREIKPSNLPFPLVPSSSKDLPATIPEAEETQKDTVNLASPTKIPRASSSSPTKSSLKQTTSRIPRTLKPYARPNSTPSVPSTVRGTTSTTGSKRSETIFDRVLPDSRANVTTGDTKPRVITAVRKVEPPQTTTLKRKHAAIEASPVKSRSLVMLRQVPGIASSAPSSSKTTLPSTAIQKKPIRRVIDKPVEMEAGPSTQVPSEMSRPSPPSQANVPEVEMLDVIGIEADDKDTIDELANDNPLPSSPDPIAESIPTDTLLPNGVRRTTRVRKPLIPTLIPDTSDGKVRRRIPQTNARSDTTYFGMSATALRALTTTNTVRNQRYLAAKLETEVIRRSGDRPESPAVKIKTVLQREQDTRGKERRERAVRRARLSGEDIDQEDGQSDSDDESDWDEHSRSSSARAHKRGAGDEEDYQTPVRKLKRLKLGDDEVGESAENQRRVKWDRGLFTTVYLDEVKVGSRQPNNNSAAKGCLASTAKTLQLDNHGNLPHADTPLADLVEENIVVKKFVYDNDIEAVEEVIVVKNTRQRSKKGKS